MSQNMKEVHIKTHGCFFASLLHQALLGVGACFPRQSSGQAGSSPSALLRAGKSFEIGGPHYE